MLRKRLRSPHHDTEVSERKRVGDAALQLVNSDDANGTDVAAWTVGSGFDNREGKLRRLACLRVVL